MKWHKYKHDPVGLGAKKFTDWHSDCGDFVCAQGLSEYERKQGKPWALLYRSSARMIMIACFAELEEAQAAAEDL